MWIWSQRNGRMTRPGYRFTASGYAGKGAGKNNPDMQAQRGIGPLPRGTYTMTVVRDSPNTGPFTITLKPSPAITMYGRSGFRIHGDSRTAPGSASNGCIILPRATRELIWNSGDHELQVVG